MFESHSNVSSSVQPFCVPVEYDQYTAAIVVHPDKSFCYKKYLDMSVTKVAIGRFSIIMTGMLIRL